MSKISTEAIMSTLPSVLRNDENTNALCEVIAEMLANTFTADEKTSIYTRIDELESGILDILAVDLKIDWWSVRLTVEEKRRVLKDNWRVHRMIGTRGAVELALSAVYGSTLVQEWFEYDGDPGYFRVFVTSDENIADSDKLLSVIEKIKYYKNVRSWLEKLVFTQEQTLPKRYIGRAVMVSEYLTLQMNEVVDPTDYTWLVDENNTMLLDENADILLDA